ncbi:PTS fructose transporter subunit IIC [Thermophilibacter immobilis]|uniref:PTS transporter subunit EIIC n=1 Tax=Thermophilibacter immobilis TaxID=2779519 RepID=A0A7S7M8V3_9ACTN|nr:fructose-specific PTS transporter subunit EIIC [Thermophilibacter immobilis]QOY60880.1 PTS transporter subunit EIIC [Thermophilibacter immobilis]
MSKKVVAITSCITGIAHTYMCAKALEDAAGELGYEIHVEKQGASGTEDELTFEQIAQADAVVFACDKAVDESRFAGKDVLKVTCDAGIKDPRGAIERAMARKGTERISAGDVTARRFSDEGRSNAASGAATIFKHVMNGVSHMLPIVVAGGILTALRYAFGSTITDGNIVWAFEAEGSLPYYISQIGATYGLGMMIAVLSAFIADSIADRPGFVPGLIGGLIAGSIQAGFIGGILAGLLAGYVTLYLNKWIQLPPAFAGLKPILILPLLSTLVVGLVMYYVVGTPVALLTAAITSLLSSLNGAGNVVLGIMCGLLYFDLGGAVSKVLYAFAIGMLDTGVYGPMAAVMLCGMVPPIGMALATLIKRDLWNDDERDSGKAAALLGCSYITEGAIPFATSYPLQVLPGCMIGGAVAAVMSLLMGIECTAPHGGMFLLLIPNVINNIGGFLLCLAVGSIVCALIVDGLMTMRRNKDKVAA